MAEQILAGRHRRGIELGERSLQRVVEGIAGLLVPEQRIIAQHLGVGDRGLQIEAAVGIDRKLCVLADFPQHGLDAPGIVLHTHGWSPGRCIPHGGHQMSLNIAAGLGLGGNESYPDLFQPYGGFPDGVRVENGHIVMPDLPGIGFEGKSDLYTEMKALVA